MRTALISRGPVEPNDVIVINKDVAIPLAELDFRFSRSSGPGGQHVNRSETQVELLFDVAHSPSLNEWQRQRVMDRLRTRIDSEGVLHLTASSSRSQHQNRQEALARFTLLLQQALRPRKVRRPTAPSPLARERRLADKRRRSQIKGWRRRPTLEDVL